jgi:hypothetical protein
MTELTFQEKSTLVSLIAVLLVGSGYVVALVALPGGGLEMPRSVLGFTLGAIALLVAIEIVLHLLSAVAARELDESEDEQARWVRLRAVGTAGLFLGFGVIVITAQILFTSAFSPRGTEPIVAAYLLMAVLLLADLLRYSLQLLLLRRGT